MTQSILDLAREHHVLHHFSGETPQAAVLSFAAAIRAQALEEAALMFQGAQRETLFNEEVAAKIRKLKESK